MAERKVVNDRYELDQPIAKGGMGEVWLGRDTRLDREVAVKFIRLPDGDDDQELIRRFDREARITARLEHPGVPAVYDIGLHDGRPYLVMQRVRGISIADLVAEQGALPVGWAAAIAAQVCAVLSAAHAASLVHRDLKPSNLMLEPHGTVKVLDFGLAVALEWGDLSRITRTGQSVGTPAYMAPEQVLAGTAGPRADLYALGCTLHEMLTGEPLFAGPTDYAVMSRQVNDRPRPVRALRPEVPAELDELVLALLRKDPEERPADADAVYERLLPFATGLGPLPGVLPSPAAPSPVRRYATVLSRIGTGPTQPAARAEKGGVNTRPRRLATSASTRDVAPDRQPSFDRDQLKRAREQAGSLVRQSRYSQAAEVLTQVAESAGAALGRADRDVISLRLELANVLFEGGDFRRAAPVFQHLAADLAVVDGPDGERVFRCRLQEATCHALLGRTSQALGQLDALLADERRVFGDDDARVLELRRQIGLLQLGAAQRDAAEKTLRELLADLTRLHGPRHPMAREVRELLDGLHRPAT